MKEHRCVGPRGAQAPFREPEPYPALGAVRVIRTRAGRRKLWAALAPLLVLSLSACDLLGGGGPGPGPGPGLENPAVASVSPTDGATGVPLDATASATFELPNRGLDATTVNGESVSLTPEGSSTPVPATINLSGDTVTLTPESLLTPATQYTFSVDTSVKDIDDMALAEAHTSTFTTVDGGSSTLILQPSATQLVFEAQKDETSAVQRLTLTNIGDDVFSLSSLTSTSDQFVLSDVPQLPAEIAAGESLEIGVAFAPISLGPQVASLSVEGSVGVNLRGLGVEGDGGDKEPSLQWIFDTFGLDLTTGDDDPATTPITTTPSDAEARSELLNSALGDEQIIQRFQKAGTGDVTVEVLAAYGVDNTPVAEFGWYEAGDAEARTKLLDVTSGAENAQTLLPDTDPGGDISFNPGSASFGFYSFWPDNQFFDARYVYSQDVLNTFSSAIPHHVRVYPYRTDKGVEPNAYVLATEEFTQGYDYNDIVVVVRNVKPAVEGLVCNQVEPVLSDRPVSTTVGDLVLKNMSGAPFADRLVFSRVGDISGDFGERIEPFVNLKCHDLNTLRLENTGSSAVSVSSLTISGDASGAFTLPNGETSLNIPAGGSRDLVVQFTEDSGDRGIREATLQLQTSEGTVPVELAGIYQQKPEGGREEYLGGVVRAFGYSTDVGTNARGEIESAEPPGDPSFERAGDEVISRFWQRADLSQPVYIRQIAAFHSCCSASSNDSLEVRVDGSTIGEFVHHELYGQAVLPPLEDQEAEAAEMFVEPSGPFELVVRNGYSTDWIGGSRNNDNLGVRLWPVQRNGSGSGYENTYIVAQDFVDRGCGTTDTANCDFNDNMYLITNVSPVAAQ